MIGVLKGLKFLDKMQKFSSKNFVVISTNDFNSFRKELKIIKARERRKLIGFTSADDELNRKILEKEKIDFFMPLLFYRKDKAKQRDSGFNQVMAKIAKKNSVSIGISLNEIINSNGKNKFEILARIRQNIKLCNKNKIKMIFLGDDRDIHDLKSLGLVLGMPTSMTKNL